jgi:hypothetical protein
MEATQRSNTGSGTAQAHDRDRGERSDRGRACAPDRRRLVLATDAVRDGDGSFTSPTGTSTTDRCSSGPTPGDWRAAVMNADG